MPIPEVDKIWMNGELVPWDEAKMHVLTHALHYGSGVFEGIRGYKTARGAGVFRLTDHLERLCRSAISTTWSAVHASTSSRGHLRRIKANGSRAATSARSSTAATARWACTRCNAPVDVVVAAWPWGAYLGEEGIRHGIRAKVSSIQALDHTQLARAAKATGQYLNSILAKVEVTNAGYDEAIMLDAARPCRRGLGREHLPRPRRHAYTPPPSDGVLEGITRDTVLRIAAAEGIEVARAHAGAQRPRDRRRALLHRHGGRDRAHPRGRRPRHRRARPDHAAHPGALPRHRRRPRRGVRALPRPRRS